MTRRYVVRQGDCALSIAKQHRLRLEDIWSHGANAALKAARRNPHVLLPGDILTLPTPPPAPALSPGDSRSFRASDPGTTLELRVTGIADGTQFRVVLDGHIEQHGAVASGVVRITLSGGEREGRVELGESSALVRLSLAFGHLNPASDRSGVRQRLSNLGYLPHPEIASDADASAALMAFQSAMGIEASGTADPATIEVLEQAHGS